MTASSWERRGRIANISVGGLLLAAHVPISVLDEKVAVDLRLDGPVRDWLRISGRIVRNESASIAVAFDDTPPAFADLITETSSDSRSNDRTMSVVLIDELVARRLSIAEAFRSAGCTVLDVATPLEAIVALGESHFEPDLIAIGDSLPGTTADELHGFVEREHPQVKLVRIGDNTVEPLGVAHWLSSSNPEDDLLQRIRRLLGRPMHT